MNARADGVDGRGEGQPFERAATLDATRTVGERGARPRHDQRRPGRLRRECAHRAGTAEQPPTRRGVACVMSCRAGVRPLAPPIVWGLFFGRVLELEG